MKSKITVVLLGKPISNNSIYKRGRGKTFYMTKAGKDLKLSYQWQATAQVGRKKPLKGSLEVWISIYFGDKRKHDYDNFGKLLNDSLNGIFWEDDVQIKKAYIELFYDKENPRIEVVVDKMVSPT